MRKWAIVCVFLAALGCGKSLEKQVRDQVRNLDSASLGEKQVRVRTVNRVGDSAVAEVEITTGVRMQLEQDRWVIHEIRFGDRHWVPAGRVVEIVNQAFAEATRSELDQVARAIRRYADEKGEVPQVADYEALIDLLVPAYLEQVLRIDAWSTPYLYSAAGKQGFELRSPGVDRVAGTSDDLVVKAP